MGFLLMNLNQQTLWISGTVVLLIGVTALAQRRGGPPGGGEASLAQPFVGVISGGKVEFDRSPRREG
jgi:hypothetical protein